MSLDTDAADNLGECGSPKADRDLAENFGLSIRQLKAFDPQTLSVTLACRFLGLPLKRFDQLAAQPEARESWVMSVARQKKDLIETFPGAGKETREVLEAIRKFALRKCLSPDGPARLEGPKAGVAGKRGRGLALLFGSGVAIAIIAGATIYLASKPQAGHPAAQAREEAVAAVVTSTPEVAIPAPPSGPVKPPEAVPTKTAARVIFSSDLDGSNPFKYLWHANANNQLPKDSLPAGLDAHCWNARTAAEFRLELVEGKPAIGLASRSDPGTAQLVVATEGPGGVLNVGHKYTLHFDYLTQGEPGGRVVWQTSKFKILSKQNLEDTSGAWKSASLTDTHTEAAPLRAVIYARAVTPDGMLYVRNVSITDDGP